MAEDTASPRLPLELEQVIFRLAAQNSSKFPGGLLLVARRTYEWSVEHSITSVCHSEDKRLEPLRYSALDLRPEAQEKQFFTRLLSQKDPSYLATHVSSILIALRYNTHWKSEWILAKFTGITDMALIECSNRDLTILGTFSHLRMLNLAYGPSSVFNHFLENNPNFVLPGLTHLDFNYPSFPATEKFTAHFPNLSHFMVDCSNTAILRLPDILHLEQISRVILKVDNQDNSIQEEANLITNLSKSHKFVCLDLPPDRNWLDHPVQRSWRERTSGRRDLWERAEEVARFQSQRT
ncbi:hypothetical protein DL96DRAFT_1568308 [Flagelloscypha sp. PMI_526]|nr:hypothetical protein DL96DRAFT_1568308 [Flagelloscypha sp. PMI_526]